MYYFDVLHFVVYYQVYSVLKLIHNVLYVNIIHVVQCHTRLYPVLNLIITEA